MCDVMWLGVDRYFAEKKNFGLPAADIMYFCQANLPCLTPAGKIILETPYGVSQAPNGNGGVYAALKASGCLADMKKRGVEYSHFYGVDNAMVKVADPMFIAFCVQQSMFITEWLGSGIGTDAVVVCCLLMRRSGLR